ncbi:MAG: TonB-dependent receptor, partial [Ferruginibacter sp.]
MKLKLILQLVALFLLPFCINAQVTTSSVGGFVKSSTGEALPGATITATHEPTGNVYRVISKAGGKFDINNMNPGGPYNITVSFVNFETFKRDEVYLTLGESSKQDFALSGKATELTTVVVSSTRQSAGKGGTETTIGRDRIANMPSVGRNITDFLRAVPQAKLTTTEGAISVAGQNNRYNAFYIDGALNNDVFGLAASGTNGGQANIAPISIDAIDQVQVVISPYDASLSGFTGGGINAITRSGTNTLTGSVYYLYRNEQLTGKTPTGDKELASRLGKFENKTYGFRVGGPIIKNKLFYFINAELQKDLRPQPFDTSLYKGNTRPGVILGLADTLRQKYNYDPGEFINNPEKVNATRITAKIDWNLSENNKLSLSYRYNYGERYNTSTSTSSTINFYNDGYIFPTTAHYLSAELRSNFNRGNSNRLLLTYGDITDNRGIIGSAFPRVSITDGSGTIVFGPDNSSTINLLTQKNYNLLDVYRFNIGRHSMSVGTDDELNNDYNAFIQNTYGNYTYNNFSDFLSNAKPKSYSVGYPLIDNKLDETTAAAAKFKTLRLAAFVNDEYRPNESLTLNFGIRVDKFSFLTQPATDTFTNNTALPVIKNFYDLKGARSGQKPSFDIAVSPRVGFTYRIKDENVTIRGGAGYFTGRIPLVWPGGVYNNNGINQGGFSASSSQNSFALDTIRFKPDPNGQYRAGDVGIKLTKGPLNLISKNFKLPKVFRISFGFDKQLGNGWTATTELLFSKNINETYYTNINILPPVGVSVGPGSRNVYPSPNTLPINANGTSPYDNAI